MSSPQKSHLKILMATSLGADIEDGYEGQLKTAHELHGAADALKQAAKKVPETFIAHVRKDLEEGKIKDMNALQVVEFVEKQLMRCGDYLGHLSEVQAGKAVSQFGRAQGMKDAMAIVAKTRLAEQEKLQKGLALVAEQEVGGDGPRPAQSARSERGSARERKAAAKAKKPAKKTARKKTAKKAARKKANG